MPASSLLALDSARLLAQGRAVLERLDDAVFLGTPQVNLGAVAGHFRHCFDFYRCFLVGLETGSVDYGARTRDPRLESERWRAVAVARELEASLAALPAAIEECPLAVVHGEGEEAEGWQVSTGGRELQFLSSHTRHHFALIGALLRFQGVEPGEEFGVAPSTLRHRRLLAAR